METTEIRHNRKKLIPMLLLIATGIIGGNLYIYLSSKYITNATVIAITAITTLVMIITLYNPVKRLVNNESFLILSPSELIINNWKPTHLQWDQITNWSIEKEEGTHYLVLQMGEKSRKINISWLNKNPSEIEVLMNSYKNRQIQ